MAAQIIHLNASDERGIDVIRNQIEPFVMSLPVFSGAAKFVVLDEADHLTVAAQHMLSNTIQMASSNVIFFVMCNFIYKIIPQLQGQFMHMHFGRLPTKKVQSMLMQIAETEHLRITPNHISKIQELYRYDARSMINFIQSNQYMFTPAKSNSKDQSPDTHNSKPRVEGAHILHSGVFDTAYSKIKNGKNAAAFSKYVRNVCVLYTIDVRAFIRKLVTYVLSKFSNNVLHQVLSKLHPLFMTAMPDEQLIQCVKIVLFECTD